MLVELVALFCTYAIAVPAETVCDILSPTATVTACDKVSVTSPSISTL